MAAVKLLSGLFEICRQFIGDDTAALRNKLKGCEARSSQPDDNRSMVLRSTARARKSPAIQDVLKRPAAPRNIPAPSSTPRPPPTTPAPLPQRPRVRASEHASAQQSATPAHADVVSGIPTHRASADADALFSVAQVQLKLQQLLQPLSALESKVQTESMRVGETVHAVSSADVTAFAITLGAAISKLGCRVVLRKITDTKQYWSKSMSNTFVVCVLPGARGKPTGLIVDPRFKEQFSTAHMTERYRDIWSALPDVFVGQVSQLMSLVQVLCHELAIMFDCLGGVLPPWRAYNAYISRWISKSCADSVVSFVDSTWVASGWKNSSDVSCALDQARMELGANQTAGSAQQQTQRPPVTITGFNVVSPA